jgi:hypothetical protein
MFDFSSSSRADPGAPFWGCPEPPTTPPVGEWAWPGRPAPSPLPAEPDPATATLVAALDDVLAQVPGQLAGPVALDRTRTLLGQLGRLDLAVGTALLDVESRELFALDAAGSAAGWLRQQPAGDGGRLNRAQRLQARPHARAAVASATLGLVSADVVCKALDRLPSSTEPGQVEGVLLNAVPELLGQWIAASAVEAGQDEVSAARAAVVQDLIETALADVTSSPDVRLEPAFVLLGQALAPAVLADQLEVLVDALQPQRLLDEEERAYADRSLRLRKKRRQPGWRLDADLTDEVGAALQADLEARARAHEQAQSTLRRAAETGETSPLFGTVGPGTPAGDADADAAPEPAPPTDEQLLHDLFGQLLDDTAAVREPGAPRPNAITINAGLDHLEGRLGTLPGTMLLDGRPSSISPEALRRAGCDGVLNAVLLDAARNPVGASGNHRHATARERRALRAKWGIYCAINGCGSTDTVPHHVRPWWLSGETRLEDLIPVCKGNHHDIHEGHRTLVLRDGRRIDEFGWVSPPAP